MARLTPKNFSGDEVISTFTELCLLAQYFELEAQEKSHFARLKPCLEEYPIYTEFLKGVRGIGPAMAGVIISEIDIHKAKYPSSLWRLAGLDTAVWFECKEKLHDTAPDRVERRHPEGYRTIGPSVVTQEDWFLLKTMSGESVGYYGLPDAETKGLFQGRSRRKEHLIKVAYTDRDGEEQERDSITFKPFLKTKLTGVLSGSFLRANSPVYVQIYHQYKTRLENTEKWAERSKDHRHKAALRYMIKMFLRDLYIAWRTLEGLPVASDYQAEKLSRNSNPTRN